MQRRKTVGAPESTGKANVLVNFPAARRRADANSRGLSGVFMMQSDFSMVYTPFKRSSFDTGEAEVL